MKKLLITGAYGLVGSNICKILEKEYPYIEVTKIKYDIPFEPIPKADYIIYAAGYGQPLRFSKDKLETIRINTEALNNAFSFLKDDGKLLFVSSSEIYSGAPSPHKETDIGITTPQHPRACYIEGKRCGEAICMAYREAGVDVKIARLALAYGPGTKKGDTRAINQFIEQALTKGEISLLDEGSALRNYIYIEDAAKLLLDILFKGSDCVYNVGGIETVSIRSLAEKIGELTGATVFLGVNAVKGAPNIVQLDMSKTISEFGGEFSPLEYGLPLTIEYQIKLYAD